MSLRGPEAWGAEYSHAPKGPPNLGGSAAQGEELYVKSCRVTGFLFGFGGAYEEGRSRRGGSSTGCGMAHRLAWGVSAERLPPSPA